MNNLKLSGTLTRNLQHSGIESLIKTTPLHTGELLCEAGEEREVYSDENAFLIDLPNIMAKGYSMMYAGVICKTYQEYQERVKDWTAQH